MAIDKLGSHVVDPNKKEKSKEAPPYESDILLKTQKYITEFEKVLPTLPKLPPPDPYPGTLDQVSVHNSYISTLLTYPSCRHSKGLHYRCMGTS